MEGNINRQGPDGGKEDDVKSMKGKVLSLLVVMLVRETAFGIPGLIAAPICYAYPKNELADRGLV